MTTPATHPWPYGQPSNEQVAHNIQRRINRQLPALRTRVFSLGPVEAMAILASLTIEAFMRLPPDERMSACLSMTDAITDSVRDSLG